MVHASQFTREELPQRSTGAVLRRRAGAGGHDETGGVDPNSQAVAWGGMTGGNGRTRGSWPRRTPRRRKGTGTTCPKCAELKLPREGAAFCPLRPYPISKMRVVPDEIEKPDWALDGIPKIEPDSDLQKRVEIKTPEQIERMRETCRIAREVLDAAARVIKPGITTDEIDRVVHEETIARG
nr:unnamed protein product [Digitaria exilis]